MAYTTDGTYPARGWGLPPRYQPTSPQAASSYQPYPQEGTAQASEKDPAIDLSIHKLYSEIASIREDCRKKQEFEQQLPTAFSQYRKTLADLSDQLHTLAVTKFQSTHQAEMEDQEIQAAIGGVKAICEKAKEIRLCTEQGISSLAEKIQERARAVVSGSSLEASPSRLLISQAANAERAIGGLAMRIMQKAQTVTLQLSRMESKQLNSRAKKKIEDMEILLRAVTGVPKSVDAPNPIEKTARKLPASLSQFSKSIEGLNRAISSQKSPLPVEKIESCAKGIIERLATIVTDQARQSEEKERAYSSLAQTKGKKLPFQEFEELIQIVSAAKEISNQAFLILEQIQAITSQTMQAQELQKSSQEIEMIERLEKQYPGAIWDLKQEEEKEQRAQLEALIANACDGRSMQSEYQTLLPSYEKQTDVSETSHYFARNREWAPVQVGTSPSLKTPATRLKSGRSFDCTCCAIS